MLGIKGGFIMKTLNIYLMMAILVGAVAIGASAPASAEIDPTPASSTSHHEFMPGDIETTHGVRVGTVPDEHDIYFHGVNKDEVILRHPEAGCNLGEECL